jgi:hypothetical protein
MWRARGLEDMKRPMRWNIRRQLAAVAVGLGVLVGSGLMTPQGASAAVASGCRTVTRSIWLQEGSVGGSVGEQRLTLRACWNSRGAITSSSLDQNLYETPLGSAAGYHFESRGTANNHPTGGTSTAWHGGGRARLCIVRYVPVCSEWEEWDTVVVFRTPGFTGPLPRNDHGATFDASCTNSACNLRFINEIH